MKRVLFILSISFFILFLSGCLTTLYPIFTEKDVVSNDNLIGYWKCLNNKNEVTGFLDIKKIPDHRVVELTGGIRNIAKKGYLIGWFNSYGQIDALYLAFLVKIGKSEYFDFYPSETEAQEKVNNDYKSHLIKFHISYKCEIKDYNHFAMKRFDKGFLEELISKQQIHLRYESIYDRKVITATTEELQKFIQQYSENPKAYTSEINYCVRVVTL